MNLELNRKLDHEIWKHTGKDWKGTEKIIDEVKAKHRRLINVTEEGTLKTYIPTIRRFFNH